MSLKPRANSSACLGTLQNHERRQSLVVKRHWLKYMRSPTFTTSKKIQIWISARVYFWRRRLSRFLGKFYEGRSFRTKYRIPKNSTIDTISFKYTDIYLISDLPKLALSLGEFSERFNTYGHIKKFKTEENVLQFQDRYGQSRWAVIDRLAIKRNEKIFNVYIELSSSYDSLVILDIVCYLPADIALEIQQLLRKPVRNRISFLRPRLIPFLKYRYLAYSSISETDTVTDRLRRYLNKISKENQNFLFESIPRGMFKELTGNYLESVCIGITVEDEYVSDNQNYFFKDILPFNSYDFEVFTNENKTVLISMPDDSWDLYSIHTYLVVARVNSDFQVPNGYASKVHYLNDCMLDRRELSNIIVINYLISIFRKFLTEKRSQLFRLRMYGFINRLRGYYKFKNSFNHQFRYFETLIDNLVTNYWTHFYAAFTSNCTGLTKSNDE